MQEQTSSQVAAENPFLKQDNPYEEYEKKHYPIEEPDPIEFIKYRMEQMNLSRKAAAR